MNKRQRVIDYFLSTLFVWGLYLLWLIPFMLLWVGLTVDEFINWITWGTLFTMIFSYPIIKATIKYGSRITGWVEQH